MCEQCSGQVVHPVLASPSQAAVCWGSAPSDLTHAGSLFLLVCFFWAFVEDRAGSLVVAHERG
jgi:hypothetical protein